MQSMQEQLHIQDCHDLDKGIKEINDLIYNNSKDPFFPELLGQMLFENGQILNL